MEASGVPVNGSCQVSGGEQHWNRFRGGYVPGVSAQPGEPADLAGAAEKTPDSTGLPGCLEETCQLCVCVCAWWCECVYVSLVSDLFPICWVHSYARSALSVGHVFPGVEAPRRDRSQRSPRRQPLCQRGMKMEAAMTLYSSFQ